MFLQFINSPFLKISPPCSPFFNLHFFPTILLKSIFISALARALRPYPISPKRIVPAHVVIPDWADDVSNLTSCLYALHFI